MRRSVIRGGGLGGAALVIALAACGEGERARHAAMLTGGDPQRGRIALRDYGCAACHTIPGVPGADGLVGPPLAGIADRLYIAGVLPNTPGNLMAWIREPQDIDPLTAMPSTGVTAGDARDIAGYLYTLRARR